MSLEEFLKDIFRMSDPEWFSNRWGQIVKEWNEKAEKYDSLLKEVPIERIRAARVRVRKLKDKLEAVRKWQDGLSYSMSPEKWVAAQGELNEILEDHSCSESETK